MIPAKLTRREAIGVLAAGAGPLLLAPSSLWAAPEAELPSRGKDLAEIETCIDVYLHAIGGDDAAPLLACFTADGELRLTDMPQAIKGQAGLAAWYKEKRAADLKAGYFFRRKILSPVIDLAKNRAEYRGYLEFDHLRFEDNRIVVDRGILSATMQRENAAWKISSLCEELWYGAVANEHKYGANGKDALKKIGRL